MILRTNTVKISGVPDDVGWSQSFEYSLDELPHPHNTSSLVIVFSTIRRNTELDDAVLGRELLKRFHEEYFSDKDRSADVSLKGAVGKIFDEFFQKFDGLEIAAACLSGNNLYAASINGGKVSLYRDGFLVKILDSNTPQLISASGFPKENDIVVLATSDFYKNMTLLEIKNSFLQGIDSVKDYFSMKIHGFSTASVALIEFVKVNAENKQDKNFIKEQGGEQPEKKESGTGMFSQNIPNFVGRIRSMIPGKRIYLHRGHSETPVVKSRTMIYLGIILTLLLGVSVVFGVYKNRRDTYKSSYKDTLNSAKLNIEDSVNLKNVEISRSREALLKGKTLLKELQEKGIKDAEIDRLVKIISENENEILGEKRIGSEMWLDLTLILDGFASQQLRASADSVYVLDNSKHRAISINVSSKKSKTITIPGEIENVRSFIMMSDEMYALTDDGVYKNSSKEKVIEKNWQDAVFIAPYSSNIYILDSQKGEILKSSGADTGFAIPKKWTTSEAENFSDVGSFTINGFVWVLNNSQVNKYSYGNRLGFELQNYPYELPKYDLLFTDENSENLYLLSKEAKTISVFDKDGVYKYNLIADIIPEVKDFIVSESSRNIILLTGGKLYLLPLGN